MLGVPRGTGPALRALIVDDDPGVRDLVEDILLELGIDSQTAENGREAEQWLRSTDFDLLFLDFNLPETNGDMILELIRTSVLRRPGAIVMMSADEALRAAPPDHWIRRGVLGFMPKPFAREAVTPFVESAKALRNKGQPAVEPAVLVAGSGLWADALTRVIYRGGGKLAEARGPHEVADVMKRDGVAVAVFGPPIPDRDLLMVAGTIRTSPELTKTPIMVGLPRTDPRLEEELQALGVTATYVVPGSLPRMSTDVISAAGLSTRTHRRAPLAAPVKLHAQTGVLDAFALDLSEGGIGLTEVRSRPPVDALRIEFPLPGEEVPVRAASQIAWTRPDGDAFRIGLRFTALEESDRGRIRRYVEARAASLAA